LRQDPERLWPDLLDWGAVHYGQRWSIAARIVLVSVAWLRIARRLLYKRDETTKALVRAMGKIRVSRD
jgi:hypothetical protein